MRPESAKRKKINNFCFIIIDKEAGKSTKLLCTFAASFLKDNQNRLQ